MKLLFIHDNEQRRSVAVPLFFDKELWKISYLFFFYWQQINNINTQQKVKESSKYVYLFCKFVEFIIFLLLTWVFDHLNLSVKP